MTQDGNSLEALIKAVGLREGNQVLDSSGAALASGNQSVPLYADAAGLLQAGGLPFTLPLLAGVTSTSAKILSVEGSSTQSANELFHQTLVYGSVASTLTVAGLMRITVTDDAGNITNGDYYVPFGTLA